MCECAYVLNTIENKSLKNEKHYRTHVKLELRIYQTQILHFTAVSCFANACICNCLKSYMNLLTNKVWDLIWTNVCRAHFHFFNSRELSVLINCMCWTGRKKSCIRSFAVFYLICYQQYFHSSCGWERERTCTFTYKWAGLWYPHWCASFWL